MSGTRFNYRITYESSLVTPRNHNKIMNLLLRDVATHHRNIRLPRRFRKGPKTRAGGEYDFDARSLKYQRRKRRKVGHLLPNVYTGKTRELARSATVRATAKRARIYFRSHFKMTSERHDEMERLSAPEKKADVKNMERDYATMANSARFRRKRKRRLS